MVWGVMGVVGAEDILFEVGSMYGKLYVMYVCIYVSVCLYV